MLKLDGTAIRVNLTVGKYSGDFEKEPDACVFYAIVTESQQTASEVDQSNVPKPDLDKFPPMRTDAALSKKSQTLWRKIAKVVTDDGLPSRSSGTLLSRASSALKSLVLDFLSRSHYICVFWLGIMTGESR